MWKQKEAQIKFYMRTSRDEGNREMRRRLKENTEIVCANVDPMQNKLEAPTYCKF